jgi:hypothetical protein
MPRKPQGDRAMTATERVHRFRERLRQKNPVLTDRQRLVRARQEIEELRKAAIGVAPASFGLLAEARQEIERLRQQLAAAARQGAATPAKPAKGASATDRELEGKLYRTVFENDRLRKKLEETRKAESEQVAILRQRIRDLEQANARRDAATKVAQSKADKPPLPPDEVRDRQIKSLKTQVRNLNQLLSAHERHYAEQSRDRGVMAFKTVSLISKALTSQRSPTDADREEALKAFNAWKSDSKAAAEKRKAR